MLPLIALAVPHADPKVVGWTSARWVFGFHDSSPLGWLIVLAYAIAAFACWRAARAPAPNPFRRFWQLHSALLIILGINKQLDLQSALIAVMRTMARQQGWFAYRRVVQYGLIIACLAIGLAAILWAVRWYRRHRPVRHSGIDGHHRSRRFSFALAGTALLATYVLLRIAAISHGGDFLPPSMRTDLSLAPVELLALLFLIIGATGGHWPGGRARRGRN